MRARGRRLFAVLSWLPVGLAAVMLAACAVGPDYVRPATPVAPVWHAPMRGGETVGKGQGDTLASWWTTLDDPELSSLIDRALAGSLDLKKARAKVREARAQRGVAKGALFPAIDATGSATRSWTSNSGTGWTSESGAAGSATAGNGSALYSAGFDASWEVDVFGGLRRSLEAAEGDLQASVKTCATSLSPSLRRWRQIMSMSAPVRPGLPWRKRT